MRLDPHYPPVFVFYRGLAQFAQDRFAEAAKTFEEAVQLNPEMLLPRLFLASAYGNSNRLEDSATAIADYSASRIRQGGLPFVMVEVQDNTPSVPEKTRLIKGLLPLKIPYTYDAKDFVKQRLTGSEIDALLFGHRVHGRNPVSGLDYGMLIIARWHICNEFWRLGQWQRHGTRRQGSLVLHHITTERCALISEIPAGHEQWRMSILPIPVGSTRFPASGVMSALPSKAEQIAPQLECL